jgi:hypothetical protein
MEGKARQRLNARTELEAVLNPNSPAAMEFWRAAPKLPASKLNSQEIAGLAKASG